MYGVPLSMVTVVLQRGCANMTALTCGLNVSAEYSRQTPGAGRPLKNVAVFSAAPMPLMLVLGTKAT
jgi:hypothetical protein